MKIALIGGGSQSFGPGTIRDVLLSDPLSGGGMELALMDIVPEHLTYPEAYGKKVAERLGRKAKVWSTTDLDAALKGADFVVTAIEVERYLYWSQDFHVPRQFGFHQIYGENGGPGGLFHALRNMGPMVHIARRMEALCPKAPMLNYTNPEAKLCEAVSRLTNVQAIGLCHGVFSGRHQIAAFLGMKPEELDTVACGINHISWFQKVTRKGTGEDLYPRLREREREADPLAQWDELALARVCLRTFGLWPSPGTNHIGEYIRWAHEFLASASLQYFYDPADGHPWETGNIPRFVYSMGGNPTAIQLFPEKRPPVALPEHEILPPDSVLRPSGELGTAIMESFACGIRHELAAVNVPNRGAIPGLGDDTVVEVPAVSDAKGLHVQKCDPLPEPIAAILRLQGSIQRLLADAFAGRSRGTLLQALLLDPTANSYRNAVCLINEMFRLQAKLLPPMEW